jgi:transcriptional regulator with XRE-family HTH domain
MEAKKLVGWNIRRLRVALGLSIEELAGKADVTAPYLGELERGRVNVSVDVLERLAKALEAKMPELFEDVPAGAKPPKPLRAGRRPKAQKRPEGRS